MLTIQYSLLESSPRMKQRGRMLLLIYKFLTSPRCKPEKPSMLTRRGLWVNWKVPTLLKPWNPEIVSMNCMGRIKAALKLINSSYIVPCDDKDSHSEK